ncbi:up-regulator of cell proliferation-like [Eleutherodactylus coqui]|uniref:up-regulator of cell proliferation-like n=1 Tax=Eleutherodactylus coqui TaxID=57060 RepID=UPI0034622BCC
MGSMETLREIFRNILQSNMAGLEQELETLLHYTLRHDTLEQTDDLRDKVRELLDILLDKGEEACQAILDNVRKNPHLFPGILSILNETRADNAMFKNMVEDLGLGKFLQQKLKLSDVQSFSCDDISDASCLSVKDIPMHFLQHLMALNIQEAFGCFDFNREATRNNPKQDTSGNISRSVHPLDVLCALLHCSDNFLRQEVIKRMSMCQVPVPLLLPAGEDAYGTFLLWAMRDIKKSFSSSLGDCTTLIEDSVVNISLPVFSFVSLGECRCVSIANIINDIQTTTEQKNKDNHVTRMMSWSALPRNISNGWVEISWYFPSDKMNLKSCGKPFAMTNLHGDLQSNVRQFKFLTEVSSAMFILIENMTKQQWNLLLHTGGNHKNIYFIVLDQFIQDSRQICSEFGLNEQNVLMESDEKFKEKLQVTLNDIIQKSPNTMTLSEMSVVASKLKFCNDENQAECEYGRLHALELIHDIVTALKNNEGHVKKQKLLKLQITKFEKELCRLRHQRELHTILCRSELNDEMHNYWEAKIDYNHSDIITNLQYAFTYMNHLEQRYFLKWMQLLIFSIKAKSPEAILEEDVFCKIGQMYEAAVLAGNKSLCENFPKAAVNLLLQGIPLELIDGDTINIHLQWIKDVLIELNTKMKGRCRIKVISVLGVQGTGKSTLLNNMFGLQFPVASRQYTRGALMSLIRVEEKDLGCDFLVVVDCEGLQSLDMASLEENYDHDNKLATLVVGLSDFVLINITFGSTSEIRSILQIVVHALLRIKGTGQKRNCLLVFQMTDGFFSEDEIMVEVKEMQSLIDKSSKLLQYNDTIECNILVYWTIPPFDLENSYYSDTVVDLKRYLLQKIKYQSEIGSFRHVLDLATDINTLWNSVKHEDYIFRFKNILEVNIYTELYEKFLELEWKMYKKIYRWWTDRENEISTQSSAELNTNMLLQDVLRMLNKELRMMEEYLQVYFTDDLEKTNSHVAKKFEMEFMEMIQSLKSQLETHYTIKCTQIKILKLGLANTIVEDFTREQWDPDDTNFNVELYCHDAVTKYQSMILKYHNVEEEFLQLLRQDMRTKGSLVMEQIHSISKLSDCTHINFTGGTKYVNKSWFLENCNHTENVMAVCHSKMDSVIRFLLEKSSKYILKMVETKTAYNQVHGLNLLNMVNEVISEDTTPYTILFQLDLKLHILLKYAPYFQRIHDDDLRQRKALLVNGRQITEVVNYLRKQLQDRKIAKNFCQDWLKPLVELKVKKMFQQKRASDYANHACALLRSRQTPLVASHGLRCSHHAQVEDTLEDICNRYTDPEEIQILLKSIISSVIDNIRMVINHPDVLRSGNIRALVAAVCSVLEEEISEVGGEISNAPFNVTVSNVLQCSSYLDFFVKKLEKQIQEEFCFKNIEQHYTKCPCPVQ